VRVATGEGQGEVLRLDDLTCRARACLAREESWFLGSQRERDLSRAAATRANNKAMSIAEQLLTATSPTRIMRIYRTQHWHCSQYQRTESTISSAASRLFWTPGEQELDRRKKLGI
jgi:hypothetical protein